MNSNSITGRSATVDVFRALTMFFMIFVNDLWTAESGIPAWLEHAGRNEDRLGFADIIFPLFLFIIGISIPFALGSRLQKETPANTVRHIVLRSVALIIMGVFHVNLESYSGYALIPEPIWQLAITAAFFLIWIDYPADMPAMKRRSFQGIGIIILITMAYFYKGTGLDQTDTVWLRVKWWGILGLLGWAYLISALSYVVLKKNIGGYFILLIFFTAFNCLAKLDLLGSIQSIKSYVWIVGDGSMPALAIAGIIVGLWYQQMIESKAVYKFNMRLAVLAGLLFTFGFLSRPLWGINKIVATPSWVAICSGIGVITFMVLSWLIDQKGKANWFSVLKPAGTSTLMCYLLPYIHYALFTLVGVSLPVFLRTGVIGIIKCLIYALLIILAAGLLEKRKIRLKL